jgi:3-hydroxymyristoyl/3-hydroxydecanoyl-(acyl carrier protein) dehydratase
MMQLDGYEIRLISKNPLCAQAHFSGRFIGFDGHFPQAPALPGFVHIQLGIDTLRLAGITDDLQEVIDAKFLRQISPDSPITIEVESHSETPGYTIQILDAANEICSRYTLFLSPQKS